MDSRLTKALGKALFLARFDTKRDSARLDYARQAKQGKAGKRAALLLLVVSFRAARSLLRSVVRTSAHSFAFASSTSAHVYSHFSTRSTFCSTILSQSSRIITGFSFSFAAVVFSLFRVCPSRRRLALDSEATLR